MKILIVGDIQGWAIDNLIQSILKYNKHHEIRTVYIGPRDAPQQEIQAGFKAAVDEFKPDVISFDYWRTGTQLLEAMPDINKNYKTIVNHQNQRTKAIYAYNWDEFGFDSVICHTKQCKRLLEDRGFAKDVYQNYYGIDLDFFTYDDNEPEELVLGYSGRIVAWKGLKELSEVALDLKLPIQMMGRHNDPGYWQEIKHEVLRTDFFDCPHDERAMFYKSCSIFICNSRDGYEEGPLPILEAMACGTPVISTPNGIMAPEEEFAVDGHNCIIVPFGDKDALKAAIEKLGKDKELRAKLRKNAYDSIRLRNEERFAREMEMVYYDTVYPKDKLVSVVIPATLERKEEVVKLLDAYKKQTHKAFEVIVIWDNGENDFHDTSRVFDPKEYPFAVKELKTAQDSGYYLAKARNLGVIEAVGEYILFNDSRLAPQEDAIEQFLLAMNLADDQEKLWINGNKQSGKTNFVENWSFAKRTAVIDFGLFCERIQEYGGMTQEIRSRWKRQGRGFSYCSTAVCDVIAGSKITAEKRMAIARSKTQIWKMYGNARY